MENFVQKLFTPIQIEPLRLEHRVVMWHLSRVRVPNSPEIFRGPSCSSTIPSAHRKVDSSSLKVLPFLPLQEDGLARLPSIQMSNSRAGERSLLR